MDKLKKQLAREELAYEIKSGKYYDGLEKQGAQDSRAVTKIIRRLITDVDSHIGGWLTALGDSQKRSIRKGTVAHMLNECGADSQELALLTLRVALRNVQRNSPYGSACVALGGYVEEHLGWKNGSKDPEHKLYLRAVSRSLKKSTSEHHSRAVARHVLRKRDVALDWDDELRTKVGGALLGHMLKATAHITTVTTGKGTKKRMFLRMGGELMDALHDEHESAILFKPFHLPMCVEPRPWTDTDDGGYESEHINMVVMKKLADGQASGMTTHAVKEVYQAINKLQRTGWRINADIFFMMRRCWMRGETVGKLPAQEDMPMPAQTWAPGTEPTPKALTEWKRDAAKVHEDNARLVSKRLAMHSKLAQAGMLCKDPEFFYVYTMDWRGRVYPCGGDLTPQADDAGRALLEFSRGKPIGDEGFFWLAVQVANTFGYDKVSNEDRVKWVLDNEEHIQESALAPMTDGTFWLKADKPWSFLAACMEWTAARAAGPEFITHLPVAQDGSANGLQHFAALMRDQQSAEAVNLVPAEKPADIYTKVADRVLELLTEQHGGPTDEGTGVDFWLGYEGDWRGLVKRPVMTVPYGVTMYGIRDQLVSEMVKRYGPDDWMPRCSFLAPLVMQAIGDVVSAATTCMDWLKEVARAAADAKSEEQPYGQAVTWTTPVGLPVVQDYRKYGSEKVEVYVGGQRKQLRIAYETPRRDHRKAKGGLSPNFIHSLDAAHLMKTVNRTECRSLAMVHDSYATLACDVGALSRDLREAFIALHEEPLLEKFRDSLASHFDVPAVPERGDFDLEQVIHAKYFFA